MKEIHFAHIAPTKHILHAAAHSGVHMALHHLTVDKAYTDKFIQVSREGGYVYLDNSEFEMGKPCSLAELIEAGHKIEASCLILPDGVMTEEACKVVRANGFDVMVIPAGPNMEEDFLDALHRDDINMVGLSYSKTSQHLGRHRHSATSRYDFLTGLGTVLPNKKIHMLGAVVPGEIALMRPFRDAIFSWDTSLAVWAGLNGVDIRLMTHKNADSVDFNSKKAWNYLCDINFRYIDTLLNV